MTDANEAMLVCMRGIWKQFGPVIANQGVDFDLKPGEIHALLGENGAGKSTLMRILYGLYRADAGSIAVGGAEVAIHSPRDAIALGIGMVTQHFALVPPLSVAENIILGQERGLRLDLRAAEGKVASAAKRFGLSVDPRARVRDLSVGQRQRVEILKVLHRNARVLILDEPTAVLTPQEIEQLFETLLRLKTEGVSVVFISHKLHEVMRITDRVTVMRAGKVVGTTATHQMSPSELARMMVGQTIVGVSKPPRTGQGSVVLKLEDVWANDDKGVPILKGVSLEVNTGEILGIAGVAGNGQTALSEVLEGTRPSTRGRIWVCGKDITNASPDQVMQAGVGRVPEDRHESVIDEMTVAENMAIEHIDEFSRFGLLRHAQIRQHAERLIAEYQIKARPNDRVRTLSGGNMQKVILARVLERNPRAIVVSQPTRGLDISATEYVHGKLLEQRQKGAAVLLISEDLDEILKLADRVAVIYNGKIISVMPAEEANPERLGLLMAGVH
ncbi:MAG: ABC transporter ATP-binding protein [Anaerolineae bacterium]|nr:ABC transporter ATP-binding protein [Anaerolineae bacterium]